MYSPSAAASASAAAESLIESVIETSQVGHRLSEEIRTIRSEVLSLKQDKRLLIVANRSLQEENNKWIQLAESNYETISSLQNEINKHVVIEIIIPYSSKTFYLEVGNRQLRRSTSSS